MNESQSAESGNENEEGKEKEKEKEQEVAAVDVSASACLMRSQTTPHETTSPSSENGEEATEAVNVRIPS